jgi:hypothetical protein
MAPKEQLRAERLSGGLRSRLCSPMRPCSSKGRQRRNASGSPRTAYYIDLDELYSKSRL